MNTLIQPESSHETRLLLTDPVVEAMLVTDRFPAQMMLAWMGAAGRPLLIVGTRLGVTDRLTFILKTANELAAAMSSTRMTRKSYWKDLRGSGS